MRGSIFMALCKIMTIRQASGFFGISPVQMWRKVKAAGIKPYKIEVKNGGCERLQKKYWYKESDFERLQKQNSRDII